MKFKLFGRTIEIRNERMPTTPGNDAAWQSYLAGAGHVVSATTALKVAAVYRCVDVIAKTMASLPLHLMMKTVNGKERATEHRLYPLLYVLPNPDTTAYEFWHMYFVNLLLTRGAFAKIARDRNGHITALYNIPTGNVGGVFINPLNGERYIDVTLENGQMERLRTGEFMYTPSLRFSSTIDPTDPIAIASDVLGLNKSLTGYASTVFQQGVNPGGFIEIPNGLGDVAYERIKKDFYEKFGGVLNAGKFLFLENGAKANLLERDLEKSQALESRKFAVIEICRIFGVPPHKVFDLERATFSNIEHQAIEFVQDCITPNAVRIEQTIFKDLIPSYEQKKVFAKFNINGLLRGDMAARKEYYSAMRQNGIMNADEIRELEDMNNIPGGLGEEYFVNGNMVTLANAKQNVPKGAKSGG